MYDSIIIALAVFPGLLICFLIYRYDKYEREQSLPLLISFLLGAVSTVPAMKLEAIGLKYGFNDPDSFGMLLVYAFIIVAFSEELVKFVAMLIYPYHQSFFNEPFDGIVYALMIGMGFATTENILYAGEYGFETTLVRAFTAVPMHGVMAVLSGYFIGKSKFNTGKRWAYLAMGFLIAVFAHGLYDFFILQNYYEWLMGVATFVLAIGGFFAIKLIKEQRQDKREMVVKEEEL